MRKTIIILVVGIMLLGVFTVFLSVDICNASGNTIYVDDSGGKDYTSIKDAINSPSTLDGDTIYVYSGTYNENIEINKILTITGENKESTTINGATTGNVVKITANNVNVSGFTIQNPVGSQMKCIMMNEVHNCKITNNIIKNSYDGIYLLGSNENNISANTIKDNDAYGIFAYYSNNNIFQNNVINFNQYGISIETNSNSNQIFNNDIRGKQGSYPQGTGVNLGTSTSGNIVYHNYFNDFAQNAKDLSTGNNWYKSSTHEGNYWDDYQGRDANHNGIGDTPYNITDGSVQDIYPLGYFVGQNQPPNTPSQPSGPTSLSVSQSGSYSTTATDPDGDRVQYMFDWDASGAHSYSTWSSLVLSGQSVSMSHSWSATGTYVVKAQSRDSNVVTSDEWSSGLIVTIISSGSNQPPTAAIDSISPNPATEGQAVSFSGSGTDNDGSIAGYLWREGTTTLSTSQSFSKSDFSVGTHTIYFRVIDDDGAWSNNVSATLVVNQGSTPSDGSPTADAGGPYSGYVNVTISFNGSGSTSDGTVTSYEWNFGDGTTGIGIYPTHKYTEAKNYTVTLTVTNNGGKTDTDTTYVNVSIKPSNQNGNAGKNKTPGFELITVIIPMVLILLWRKRKL